MRLATFNVENLFARAKALGAASVGDDNPVLRAFERFNTVSGKLSYEPADRAAMLEDLETLDILERTRSGALRMTRRPFEAWALLRENRGDFLRQPRSGDVTSLLEVATTGSAGWSSSPSPSMRSPCI